MSTEENAPDTIRTPVSHTIPSKRPRPIVRKVTNESQLAWTPVALETYTVVDGQNVRAGESFAVVRPEWERWPLGIVSDHYKVIDHNATRRAILEGAGDRVTLSGAIVAGHGYHVAHSFEIKHLQADTFEDAPVKSRLVVAHDHTGIGALRAAMVVYVGDEPLGALIRARAMHVARQPASWSGEIDGMIEKSIIAQDLLLDIIKAAKERKLADVDHEWLVDQGIKSKKGKKAENLLDAVKCWFEGNVTAKKMTWGVWERRLDDFALRVMIEMLGLAKFGTPLDTVLGGKRYGRGKTLAQEATAA